MDENKSIIVLHEKQFDEVISIIQLHRSKASRMVNEELLQTAWYVGSYVSAKLKSEEWGSKVVSQLSEYIRARRPDLRGYSRRNIYNMVQYFEEYSTPQFSLTVEKFLSHEFVQSTTAQLQSAHLEAQDDNINERENNEIVQLSTARMPQVLTMTTFTNHTMILSRYRNNEERLFYILYTHKERLNVKELDRSLTNQTFSTLLSDKKNLSKGLLESYPYAPVIFKDIVFLDFLGLPKKHSESKLRNRLIEHMKQFILELGKDFLFMDQEYSLPVGGSTFKADLLFFHRGLQALIAVELKKTKFHPRDLGQLEFYLEALDRDVKRTNENPSIGIILCPEADEVVVEYAMNRSMSPTMVAEYKRLLIPKELMQQQLNEFCSFFLKDKGTNIVV